MLPLWQSLACHIHNWQQLPETVRNGFPQLVCLLCQLFDDSSFSPLAIDMIINAYIRKCWEVWARVRPMFDKWGLKGSAIRLIWANSSSHIGEWVITMLIIYLDELTNLQSSQLCIARITCTRIVTITWLPVVPVLYISPVAQLLHRNRYLLNEWVRSLFLCLFRIIRGSVSKIKVFSSQKRLVFFLSKKFVISLKMCLQWVNGLAVLHTIRY